MGPLAWRRDPPEVSGAFMPPCCPVWVPTWPCPGHTCLPLFTPPPLGTHTAHGSKPPCAWCVGLRVQPSREALVQPPAPLVTTGDSLCLSESLFPCLQNGSNNIFATSGDSTEEIKSRCQGNDQGTARQGHFSARLTERESISATCPEPPRAPETPACCCLLTFSSRPPSVIPVSEQTRAGAQGAPGYADR